MVETDRKGVERVRPTNVLTTGVLLGLAVGLAGLSALLLLGSPRWRPSWPQVRPLGLLVAAHIGVCCLALAGATAAAWAWQKRLGHGLAGQMWRRRCVLPVSAAACWLTCVCCVSGPPHLWVGLPAKDWTYALGQAALLLPIAVLAGFAATWTLAGRWTWSRAAQRTTAAAVTLLLVASTPFPVRSERAPRSRRHDAATSARGSSEQPIQGVVLIVLDALRADHLSCAGSTLVSTPTIDSLARQGVLFTQAVSQAPWTLPSVGSIMTARYPSVHGAGMRREAAEGGGLLPDGLSADVATMAELMKWAGYACGAFVTNGMLDIALGYSRGFELYRLTHDFRPYPSDMDITGPRSALRVKLLRTLGRAVRRRDNRDCDWCVDRVAVRQAAEWVRARASGRFFLWAHLMATHEYRYFYAVRDRGDGDASPLSPRGNGANRPGEIRAVRAPLPGDGHAEPALDELKAWYVANVMFDDALISILIEELKALGVFENTLVIITSDHGEEFLEHGNMGHGHTLFDEVIRVPLVMVCPARLPSGRVVTEQVRMIDVMPTILDLAEIRCQEGLSGRSLLGVIAGKSEAPRVAFSEFDERIDLQSTRKPAQKLIRRLGQNWLWLHDLETDPGEQHNIADRRPEDVAALSRLHMAWRQGVAKARRSVRPLRAELPDEYREKMRALGYLEPEPRPGP